MLASLINIYTKSDYEFHEWIICAWIKNEL